MLVGTIWEAYTDLAHMASSFNHPMFSSFEPFLYKTLAGISPAAPGFARTRIRPQILGKTRSLADGDTVIGGLHTAVCTRVR